MNYIVANSFFDIAEADMAQKTPQELADIGRQAASLALSRIPAIEDTVPTDFTPHQRRVYIATLKVLERPSGSHQTGAADGAEQKPKPSGLLAGLFHG